jgi:AcrR family transcriptional regulator
MPKRIDRRVARTRQQLQAALIALMQQRAFEEVTVEEICAAANVGRSTFYTHFTGRDDLLRKGLKDFEAQLAEGQTDRAELSAAAGRFSFVLPMFAHAQGHAEHYRAHLTPAGGGGVALEAIHDIVLGLVRRGIRSESRGGDLSRDVAEQFMTGGFVAILTWWLAEGGKPSRDRVGALATSLLEGSLDAVQARDRRPAR